MGRQWETRAEKAREDDRRERDTPSNKGTHVGRTVGDSGRQWETRGKGETRPLRRKADTLSHQGGHVRKHQEPLTAHCLVKIAGIECIQLEKVG